jgi:uncharacterized protein (DUF433 family)
VRSQIDGSVAGPRLARYLATILEERIAADPGVMLGKPCINGTRITVELLPRKLASGRSAGEVLEAYPQLVEDDLRAALWFAADYLRDEAVLTIGS